MSCWFHFRKRDLLWLLLRSLLGLALFACGGVAVDAEPCEAPAVAPVEPPAAPDAAVVDAAPDARDSGTPWCLECDTDAGAWACYPICQRAGGQLRGDGITYRCCGPERPTE